MEGWVKASFYRRTMITLEFVEPKNTLRMQLLKLRVEERTKKIRNDISQSS